MIFLKNKHERTKIVGEVVYTLCDIATEEAKRIQDKIVYALYETKDWGLYKKATKELHDKFMVKRLVVPNRVVTVGKEVLCRLLSGDTTYSGEVNYCALGIGSAASTIGDITLSDEVYRKLVSSATYEDNKAYLSTFFTATETTGTYREIGHFIDGTAVADSGQLWSRIAKADTGELPLDKSNTESLTIDYKVTFPN